MKLLVDFRETCYGAGMMAQQGNLRFDSGSFSLLLQRSITMATYTVNCSRAGSGLKVKRASK